MQNSLANNRCVFFFLGGVNSCHENEYKAKIRASKKRKESQEAIGAITSTKKITAKHS